MPVASAPAGIEIVTEPLDSVTDPDVYVPLVNMTVPVGVGVPLTVTITDSACAVVMLAGDGETVTAGVVFAGAVMV